MLLTIAEEDIREVYTEMNKLLLSHYIELVRNKAAIVLEPDWERYFELSAKSKFFILTVRSENRLVGYSAFFVDTHIHYKNLLVATNDVIFLDSDNRRGLSGLRLIKASEVAAKAKGANKIVWHIKLINDFRKILYRLGYEDDDFLLSKLL